MKAVVQYQLGGPDVLQYVSVPDPLPGKGQVHIAVHVAGVHLVDTAIREGAPSVPDGQPVLPMTPGREVAGVVDAVGAETDPSWIGRRVVVHLGFASGGYAEQAVADASACIPLADDVDEAAAVAMVGTGRTAMAILELADLTAKDVVLVTAAAGGIGSLLVQASLRAGATVVGAAGGAEKVETVTTLGAHVAVDYHHEHWSAEVAEQLGERRVTVAFDGVGGANGRAAFELVAPAGRMILYGSASGAHLPLAAADLFASGVTVAAAIGARLFQRPGGFHALAELALRELTAHHLTPLIHPPFALAHAADAHRAIAGRATTGKVVLVPSPPR